MKIAELFARVRIKTDTGKLLKLTAQLTIAALAMKKLVVESLDAAAALRQFEAETGASTESLQRWTAAAERTNVSGKAVAESIRNIVANQEKIRLGQGDISGYQLLGLDPTQDPFVLLDQLRDKTRGLNAGMKKNILAQMGISPEMVRVLNMTNKEFDDLANNAFIMSESTIRNLDGAKSALREVGQAFRWIGAQVADFLSPIIVEFSGMITDLVKQLRKGISPQIMMVVNHLKKFAIATGRAIRFVSTLALKIINLRTILAGLVMALVVMNKGNMATMFTKGGLYIGIMALILLLEDLYVYSKGGDSLLGPGLDFLVEKFEILRQKAEPLVALMREMSNLSVEFAGLFIKSQVEFGPKYYESLNKQGGWTGNKGGSTTNNYYTTVDTKATDPEGTAKAVEKVYKKDLSKAYNRFVPTP